ncbi:MAG TPA: polysaccharide deacetylase family protein [Kofleriaceae bacterium]|nr:polysaccharide deacetylase family protein [Kofleriaceae bacterium]
MVTSLRATVKNAVIDRIPGVLRRGPATVKRIALTFDDGPDEQTPALLELLDDLGVPATFFLCGVHATEHPDLVREYLRRGHQIANHGYDHTRFSKLGRKALLDQLSRTDVAIGGQATGKLWVRPPHGAFDTTSLISMRTAGYTVAMWSVDSLDHTDNDPASLAERCGPANVGPGDVLLFHEGQPWTREALPRIVASLHASGLECVTMHDLFAR